MKALFALIAAAPLCAVAQSPSAAIHTGSRLRLVAVDTFDRANGQWRYLKPVGSVASFDAQTLVLFFDERAAARGSAAIRVPTSNIIRVEESVETRRNVWQGGLVGGGAGAGLAYLSDRDNGRVAAFAIIGATVGAVTGYFLKTEVWHQVDVGRLRLQVGLK